MTIHPSSPPFEYHIGIENFYTDTPSTRGQIRTRPRDFHVQEIYKRPSQDDAGRHTIAEVTSINWDTHNLVREFSHRLNISRKRINFAGTKDKRAQTTQLISFHDIRPEQIESIHIKDVEIKNIYKSNKNLAVGDLQGNSFTITIRNVDPTMTDDTLQKTTRAIQALGGFPNFYGVQRFGTIRPITHIMGRHLIDAEFEKAVMTYIANPHPQEKPETYAIRKELEETRDYKKALKDYPKYLTYEKAMVNRLIQQPEDYIGALKELPHNLLTMFINAYQSYLFNKIISRRMQQGLPLDQALPGDVIVPIRKHSIDIKGPIEVTDYNIDKINRQMIRGNCYLTGILVGNTPHYAKGEMGEIEHSVIDAEHIDVRNFTIPAIPRISSHGSRRTLLTSVGGLTVSPLCVDDADTEKKMYTLSFSLTKGSYATSLLREYMKADSPRSYS